MKISIQNVYNTQAIKKDIAEIKLLIEKNIDEILKLLPSWNCESSSTQYVDWRNHDRGEDIRFSLVLTKDGRGGETLKRLYSVCNTQCERPCYFSIVK